MSVALQGFWLSHPSIDESAIIYSDVLVPFLCAWGLQFAHQVGRMILAHVTKTDFPYWDSLWIWSLIGAVDANLPKLIGRCVITNVHPTFSVTQRNVYNIDHR